MKTIEIKNLTTGEVINASVKSVSPPNKRFRQIEMDSKGCNVFHNSKYDPGMTDSKVVRVDFYISGKTVVWGRYRTAKGWTRGLQVLNAEVIDLS